MPPAAPSFQGVMSSDKSRFKKLVHSAPTVRRPRKFDIKTALTEARSLRRPRVGDDCEDEDEGPQPSKKKRLLSRLKEAEGDCNLVASGDEDNSDEIDFADYSDNESNKVEGDEDSDDEDHVSTAIQKKKFYVVQNDGRPAELYRTDLIHRLRNGEDQDSDDEGNPMSGLLRLTDRWREEWNHGVQVPLKPKSSHPIETAPNDFPRAIPSTSFTLPRKYIGTRVESRVPSYVTPSTHEVQSIPERRLYHGDRLDEIWLEKINKSRKLINRYPIKMDLFLKVMNEFEVNCYERIHELLLAPLHSPSAFDEVDEEAACDICRGVESEPDDCMVFCEGCNMCVHMSCYGLPELPEGDWICMKCTMCYGQNPPCLLCPTSGGALKCTKKMEDNKVRWAHVACALWIPECRFGDVDKREPITQIEEILDERWQLKCSICDTRQGACIQCSHPSCRTAFHVTCALRSGLELKIEQDPDPTIDAVCFVSLCSRHSDGNKDIESTKTTSSSDEEHDTKENVELKQLESYFYLHVDYEFVSKRLNIDLITVSDIYEYWKLKRSYNNGKPLIRNPQDEIKLNPLDNAPILSLPNVEGVATNSRINRYAGNIRTSLDKGRILLCSTHKREKERMKLVRAEWAIVENIFEQMLLPNPLSQRVLDKFTQSIESITPPDALLMPKRSVSPTKAVLSSPKSRVNSCSPVKKENISPAPPPAKVAKICNAEALQKTPQKAVKTTVARSLTKVPSPRKTPATTDGVASRRRSRKTINTPITGSPRQLRSKKV